MRNDSLIPEKGIYIYMKNCNEFTVLPAQFKVTILENKSLLCQLLLQHIQRALLNMEATKQQHQELLCPTTEFISHLSFRKVF